MQAPIDKFVFSKNLINASVEDKVSFIERACSGRSVLDMGCVCHNAEFAVSDPNWLHKKIKAVAKDVMGLDYLPQEVAKLRDLGYNIIYGDASKPIDLDRKFDVIVAGDLIEHLHNFEGFFENCKRLLNKGGRLLVTTPNPFFADEFHYVAFRNTFLINPEHTCWIDPMAMSHLAGRFGFRIEALHFLSGSWKLKNLIFENPKVFFDILNGKWINDTSSHKQFRRFAGAIFGGIYTIYRTLTLQNSKLVRYSDYIAVLTVD